MIKKQFVFHSFFLLFLGLWIIIILNTILNAYSISFLTSPSTAMFGGYFGLFYWLVVSISALTSCVIGLDKLGLLTDLWKKISNKNKNKNKSKGKPLKSETEEKKQVIDKQTSVPTGIIDVKLTKKEKDTKKAFYLFGETKFESCQHKFGYLESKLKNKPIPDECFGCSKLLDCSTKTKKSKKKKHELSTIL